ncbi:UNVERIFIED_CONTAM: hypothetical protein FKN15_045003 [Acipenser sinensis]
MYILPALPESGAEAGKIHLPGLPCQQRYIGVQKWYYEPYAAGNRGEDLGRDGNDIAAGMGRVRGSRRGHRTQSETNGRQPAWSDRTRVETKPRHPRKAVGEEGVRLGYRWQVGEHVGQQ